MDETKLLDAITDDPYLISEISNPSEKVQMVAVTCNGFAIGFIENPSDNVKLAAVTENGAAIEYIYNPSELLQIMAVTEDWRNIGYINEPYRNAQIIAVVADLEAATLTNLRKKSTRLPVFYYIPIFVEFCECHCLEMERSLLTITSFDLHVNITYNEVKWRK